MKEYPVSSTPQVIDWGVRDLGPSDTEVYGTGYTDGEPPSAATLVRLGTPVVLSALTQNTLTGMIANFTASVFIPINIQDTHIASSWQISTQPGFGTIVAETVEDGVNLTTWTYEGLTVGTVYYVRVKYRGKLLGASEWSTGLEFQAVSGTIVKPSITSPANGASGLGPGVGFTSSAFSVLNDLDTHASSSWEVATDVEFTQVVASTVDDVTALTSWSTSTLMESSLYYVRVRHKGTKLGDSPWSDPISFITKAYYLAAFSGTPLTGVAPLPVGFTDESTGGPTAWSWDFGDGATSTLQNPTHTYLSPGTYSVTLTVSAINGDDSLTKTAYVTVIPPVVAEFSGTPLTGSAPLTVQFSDLTTGNPSSWLWDFGDSTTSNSQNPSHVYTQPGTYTVSLIATGPGGSDTLTKVAYVIVTGSSMELSIAADQASQAEGGVGAAMELSVSALSASKPEGTLLALITAPLEGTIWAYDLDTGSRPILQITPTYNLGLDPHNVELVMDPVTQRAVTIGFNVANNDLWVLSFNADGTGVTSITGGMQTSLRTTYMALGGSGIGQGYLAYGNGVFLVVDTYANQTWRSSDQGATFTLATGIIPAHTGNGKSWNNTTLSTTSLFCIGSTWFLALNDTYDFSGILTGCLVSNDNGNTWSPLYDPAYSGSTAIYALTSPVVASDGNTTLLVTAWGDVYQYSSGTTATFVSGLWELVDLEYTPVALWSPAPNEYVVMLQGNYTNAQGKSEFARSTDSGVTWARGTATGYPSGPAWLYSYPGHIFQFGPGHLGIGMPTTDNQRLTLLYSTDLTTWSEAPGWTVPDFVLNYHNACLTVSN
jgi:PKD repeat protein